MGRDKGLVQLDGRPLVEHVRRASMGVGQQVFLVTNRPEAYAFLGLRTASDREPGRGSLEGLRSALSAGRSEHVLVVACDMPFVRPALLRHLAAQAGSADAVVPRYQGQLQPFLALYSRRCLPAVEQALCEERLEVRVVLQELNFAVVEESELRAHDPRGLSFYNLNTPEDLERAGEILQQVDC